MVKSFEIKTEEELMTYGTSRSSQSIVSSQQWANLLNESAKAIGYERKVNENGTDNRISPPDHVKKAALAMNKKIRVTSSEDKKTFLVTTVAA